MLKRAAKASPWLWAALAVFALAAALRFTAIGYGLPHTFNAGTSFVFDEVTARLSLKF